MDTEVELEGLLKNVEETSRVTAEHSIRCSAKWDQYEKDQKRVSDRLGKLENSDGDGEKRQIMITGALIAAIMTLVEAVKHLVS